MAMNLNTHHHFNPTFFSNSHNHSPSNHNPKLAKDSVLIHGFCNSAKKVPNLLTNKFNHSVSTRLVQDPILAYGFCKPAKRVSKSMIKKMNRVSCEVGLISGDENENDDGFYMRRCVEIAKKGIGCTSPNPMVGCVLVRDGKIVGEGFHPKAGQPHAEVFALRDAGDLAENSTAYVSLEPCNHYGRTPPCSEALIKAKIKKVVVGMVDPNPIVASKGVAKLRNAGIEVRVGVEEELCKKLNEAYIHQMLNGRPFITLRYSLSINGRFSNWLGEDVTKTGGYYSKLLQEYDSILISSDTLLEHPTFPSSLEPGTNKLLKIVMAKNLISASQVPKLSPEEISTVIIFTDKERVVESEIAQRGIETVILDRMSLVPVLEYCKSRGSCSLLLDIRGNIEDFEDILKEGFEQNLFQKVVVEILPIWDGNNEEFLPKSLKELKLFSSLTSRNSSNSVVLEGYL